MARLTFMVIILLLALTVAGCPSVPPEIVSIEVCEEATDLSCIEDQDVLDASASSIFVAIDHTGFEPNTRLRITTRHLEGDEAILYRNVVRVSKKAQRVILELPKPAPAIGEWPAGLYEVSAELDAPDVESIERSFNIRSKNPPGVTQLTICEELDDFKCNEPAEVYGTDEPEIYIIADLVNSSPGKVVDMNVELVDEKRRRVIKQSALEVEPGKAGVILHLKPPGGLWLEGSYEVSASLKPEQNKATVTKFIIEDGPSVAR